MISMILKIRKCPSSLTICQFRYRGLSTTIIDKILIANRGEIACRIARTAKSLGIKVVAVYSDADDKALHVSIADEAVHIGPAISSESYLRSDKLLEVARKTGCQAIHPGYGFLSENADFAEKCHQAGFTFIGPPATAIRNMGCKSTSKKIMEAAGVPVVTGYHGDDQSDSKLKLEADRIGYPVMLKALKGGGGKGMRAVMNSEEFTEQLTSARNEASKAFGDTAMLVEKFVSHPRHVEVQVFGDQHGNYVHLHERDCSVQRRHQKIIEEAPAPGLPDDVRKALGEAAVRAAKAVNYVGAGTVEFILDAATYEYFFMEMNTRLQVEHPVSEMITNTDLVQWQIKVAAGEKLPMTQNEISAKGHAFEARVYAEDPENGFLPQAGVLAHFSLPILGNDVRVDTGVQAGDSVPVFYDPLIAKLIVWGHDRTQALRKLHASLAALQISGVPTNINFLMALAGHQDFQSGKVHTNFITQHDSVLLKRMAPNRELIGAAILAHLFKEVQNVVSSDVFQAHSGFRVNHSLHRTIHLVFQGEDMYVNITYLPNGDKRVEWKDINFVVNGKCNLKKDNSVSVELCIDGAVERYTTVVSEESLQVFGMNGVVTFNKPKPGWQSTEDIAESGDSSFVATSPMPGVVDQVLVSVGDSVTKGQAILTVIAMKMEYVVRAPSDGIIDDISQKPGDAVAKGAVLARLQNESHMKEEQLAS